MTATFHAITPQSWQQAHQELTSSERSVYFLIASQVPFGDRQARCAARELSASLKLGLGTVNRALHGLAEKGWLLLTKVENTVYAQICRLSQIATDYLENGGKPETEQPLPERNSRSTSATPVAEMEHTPYLNTPNTNNTLSDLEADERESEDVVEGLTEEGSKRETQAAIATPPTPSVKTPPPVTNKSPARQTERETGSASTSKSPWIEGPWLTASGQLDGAFVDEVANKWVRLYGGYLHERRVHVISHFAKNPGINLPKEWEWYEEEFATRARSAQQTHEAGMEVGQDRIGRLVANQRALTARMSEEQRLTSGSVLTSPPAIAGEFLPVGGSDRQPPALANEAEALASPLPPLNKGGIEGGMEDIWERVAESVESFEAEVANEPAAAIAPEPQSSPPPEGLAATKLRLLNDWLTSGIPDLRKRAIAWVERESDRFRLEWDEQGKPVRVVAV